MQINVSTKELQEVTKKLLKIAPKKSTIPVLENILIVAEGGVVTAIATDCDLTAAVTFKNAEVYQSGSHVIPRETIQLIHKLKSDYMTITNDSVTAANRKVSYRSMPADLFPDVNAGTYDQLAFNASKHTFLNIADIRFACYGEVSQPILTGVLLRDKQAFATDRHRLALRYVPEYQLDRDIVIPGKVFEHAERFSEKAYTGAYSLSISDYGAKLTFDNVVMQFRLIAGTFPNVKQIIPNSFKSSVKVNKQALIEELTLMKEISSSERHLVKLRAHDGKLVLSAESEGTANKVETELEAQISGDMDDILFNAAYLLDGLKYSSNDEVTFNFTGAFSPAMIDTNYLVLPYRLPAKAKAS